MHDKNLNYKSYTLVPSNLVTTSTIERPTVIIVTGDCPHCQNGVLVDDYGFCSIFLAIVFFPIGILCCLLMKERVCTNCGARF